MRIIILLHICLSVKVHGTVLVSTLNLKIKTLEYFKKYFAAQRLGKVNVKVALAKILTNYNIEIQDKRELEFNIHGIGLEPKDNISVKLSKRKNKNN